MFRTLRATVVAFSIGMAFAQSAAAAPLWDGFYLGANIGYSWGRSDEIPLGRSNAGLPIPPDRQTFDGWLAGGQFGRNWQLTNRVYGFEVDTQMTGERGSWNRSGTGAVVCEDDGLSPPHAGCDTTNQFSQTLSGERKLTWFSTLRGRFGVLIDPQSLLYGTGGLALGHFAAKLNSSVSCVTSFTPPCAAPGWPTVGDSSMLDNTTRIGWVLGAGVEKHLFRQWSLKFEYLYIDYGRHTFFDGTTNAVNVRLRDQVVRLGLNYALQRNR